MLGGLHRPVEELDDPVGGGVPGRGAAVEPVGEVSPQLHLARRQQMVFGAEVAVDGAQRDLGPGGDVTHLHRVVAPFGGEAHRGVEHPVAASGLIGGEGLVVDDHHAGASGTAGNPPTTRSCATASVVANQLEDRGGDVVG